MLRAPQHHPGHERRGRGCCAISERPTLSPFVAPSLFPMLSPTIPVHPRTAPVSPIIPARLSRARPRDTQKQGGGVHFPVHHSPPSLPLLPSRSPLATRLPAAASAEEGHSPLTPIIPAPLATAALRVVPAPIFTTTASTHVGAPTILFRERTTARQQFPDRRAMLSSNCALLTVDCELLFSPNSNHSRTYARVARKSNYSRTYAKQGGGGR